jgi:hypothetical protein
VKTDLSVKATDYFVGRTVFGPLEHKPNFPVAQQILFFSVNISFEEKLLLAHRN